MKDKSASRLDRMVADLAAALGGNLQSIVLYGSAARGDHSGTSSDLNVLVVVGDDSPVRIEAAGPTARRWARENGRPLLVTTQEWIRTSTDVFPIEFLDMLDARRVIHGADPLGSVSVAPTHLRLQCESEARSAILKMRAAWLEASEDDRTLSRLVASALGTIATIARAALRLTGDPVPTGTEDALAAAAARFGLEAGAFQDACTLKRTGRPPSGRSARDVFLRFFEQTEALGRSLDALPGGTPPR